MNSEKVIVWSIRLITIAIISVPLAFCYFTSGSLLNFLIPDLITPTSLMNFDLDSIRMTSFDYKVTGNTYLLMIKLSYIGNMRIGLNKFDATMAVPSLNISGRFTLQSPFVLEPGEEETVNITFFLESGTHEDLRRFLSLNPPMDLSGMATLILNSAELPFTFSITLSIPR